MTDELLWGALEAYMTKQDRDKRGTGMQGFRYNGTWFELCHIVQIISPAAYKAFQKFLPGPNARTFKSVFIYFYSGLIC